MVPEYMIKIRSKKVHKRPCKNCIALVICSTDYEQEFFDIIKKCNIVCKFVVDEIESKYKASLKDIIDNNLYECEIEIDDEADEGDLHIWNSMVLAADAFGREDCVFEQFEHYVGEHPNFRGFIEDALEILKSHKNL